VDAGTDADSFLLNRARRKKGKMAQILLLMFGGAIGAAARYFTSVFTHKWLGMGFPWGTLVANSLGALIIGVLWGLWERKGMSVELKSFLFVGVLGSFTTFSTFSLENLNLLKSGEYKLALFNILANNILALTLVILGYVLGRWFSQWTQSE